MWVSFFEILWTGREEDAPIAAIAAAQGGDATAPSPDSSDLILIEARVRIPLVEDTVGEVEVVNAEADDDSWGTGDIMF